MSKEIQRSDEELFSAALAFSSFEEQNQCVILSCENDHQQLVRVLHLLESHRRLAEANTAFVLDRSDELCSELMSEESLAAGAMIGSYRITQLLGEGGMGLVYQAEQLSPIRRHVAVKVLKPGMDSHKVLARFELERQALAGMEHPGITHVLDAGIADSGLPYFVMELVKGISITAYCREHELFPLDCIQLMIHVCNAIQHAHQRGIIHRDIKPSNILVTQSDHGPMPKVIDFGIAKLVDESISHMDQFTLQGEMIGTPEYMSPEQALRSEECVDTRTDVYSLGVVLYELFTGETPLGRVRSEAGFSRLRQLMNESRVELPSQRVARRRTNSQFTENAVSVDRERIEKVLRGDIDCIVMKALARDPNDRYQSVSELRQDLERFVKGRPIEAVPPSFLYQFKKLVTRHRFIAMGATLVCITILFASATAILFGVIASDRLRDILAMQSALRAERDRAVEAERKAILLAQTYLAPAVLDRSIVRFSVEHWDLLVQTNPKLKRLPVPMPKQALHAEVQATFFDSNLLTPDERVTEFGESVWLIKILSDISRKDMGPLLNDSSQLVATNEVAAVSGDSTSQADHPLGQDTPPTLIDGLPVSDRVGSVNPSPSFRFPSAAKKAYLEVFCEELRAMDRNLPVVADAEDGIGLCLLDMGRPDLAVGHFRESVRIREGYPELRLQWLQSELFIAECLKRQGKQSEAKAAIAKVRSEFNNHPRGSDPAAIEKLSRAADAIESPTPTE